MPPAPFVIRPATPADTPRLIDLVLALMAHLGDAPDHFDAARFTDDAFGADPQFRVFVAERASDLIGYTLFLDAYEPAFSARGVYMADLYVCAAARRQGVGRALVSQVAKDAAARGRTFVWWVARGDDARAFYRTLADVEQPTTAHALTFDAFDRLVALP